MVESFNLFKILLYICTIQDKRSKSAILTRRSSVHSQNLSKSNLTNNLPSLFCMTPRNYQTLTFQMFDLHYYGESIIQESKVFGIVTVDYIRKKNTVTVDTNLRLEKVHGLVTLGLLPVELHALVDPLLESLHHALPEDEADHDGDELYQVETAETQRILKI